MEFTNSSTVAQDQLAPRFALTRNITQLRAPNQVSDGTVGAAHLKNLDTPPPNFGAAAFML